MRAIAPALTIIADLIAEKPGPGLDQVKERSGFMTGRTDGQVQAG
jgi:hypothetical protein